jgi:molybdate transport system substrate-binding protein
MGTVFRRQPGRLMQSPVESDRMRPNRLIIPGLGIVLMLAACTSPAGSSNSAGQPVTLTVFAAASLTESFGEIGTAFEAVHPGVKVVFNFAGSQQLAQQLAQGAPADVFASANPDQMAVAVQQGRIAPGSPQTFVENRLVVIVPRDNPAGITDLQDLAKSGLRIVLAAQEVPVGQYSLDFLVKATQAGAFGTGYRVAVLKNVVSYEDNVKAVLSKVILGEADAGIVYTSDLSGDNATRVIQIDIPDAYNVIATYPIAAVIDSPNSAIAADFIDFVLSKDGQSRLAKYGFIPLNR